MFLHLFVIPFTGGASVRAVSVQGGLSLGSVSRGSLSWRPPQYGGKEGSMHPTGIHPCLNYRIGQLNGFPVKWTNQHKLEMFAKHYRAVHWNSGSLTSKCSTKVKTSGGGMLMLVPFVSQIEVPTLDFSVGF